MTGACTRVVRTCLQGFVEVEDKAAKAAEEEEVDDEDWSDLERFQVSFSSNLFTHSHCFLPASLRPSL